LFCLKEAELLEVSKRVEQLPDQVLLKVVGRVHAHHKRRPEEGRRPDEPDDIHKKGEPHTTDTIRARLSRHQNKSIRRGGEREREREKKEHDDAERERKTHVLFGAGGGAAGAAAAKPGIAPGRFRRATAAWAAA
jgi:hypothetical protein